MAELYAHGLLPHYKADVYCSAVHTRIVPFSSFIAAQNYIEWCEQLEREWENAPRWAKTVRWYMRNKATFGDHLISMGIVGVVGSTVSGLAYLGYHNPEIIGWTFAALLAAGAYAGLHALVYNMLLDYKAGLYEPRYRGGKYDAEQQTK